MLRRECRARRQARLAGKMSFASQTGFPRETARMGLGVPGRLGYPSTAFKHAVSSARPGHSPGSDTPTTRCVV